MNKLPNLLLCLAAIFCGWIHAAPVLADGPSESVIGPEYHDAPEVKAKEGVPVGELHKFTMDSADSKMYPGIAKGKPGVTPYKPEHVFAKQGKHVDRRVVNRTLPGALEWLWQGYAGGTK
jgi:hypothetical protein